MLKDYKNQEVIDKLHAKMFYADGDINYNFTFVDDDLLALGFTQTQHFEALLKKINHHMAKARTPFQRLESLDFRYKNMCMGLSQDGKRPLEESPEQKLIRQNKANEKAAKAATNKLARDARRKEKRQVKSNEIDRTLEIVKACEAGRNVMCSFKHTDEESKILQRRYSQIHLPMFELVALFEKYYTIGEENEVQ